MGVNGLEFRRLPIGELFHRYGRAVARLSGIRVNANMLMDGPVVVWLNVPQFGEAQAKQTNLAFMAPRTKVRCTWADPRFKRGMKVRDVLRLLRDFPAGVYPCLFRLEFTTYFGRWEVPGRATRIALRISGLPDVLQPVFTASNMRASDPSLSCRLVRTDILGEGISSYLEQNSTILGPHNSRFAAYADIAKSGCAFSVWEVQDAALLAVQTLEVGVGLRFEQPPLFPDEVLDLTLAPTFAGSLAPHSTVGSGSMRTPVPRFVDCSVILGGDDRTEGWQC
jgi:hypothetical protein